MAELKQGYRFGRPPSGNLALCCWAILLCLLVSAPVSAQVKAFASLQPERIETGDTTALLIIVSGLNNPPKDVDFINWRPVFPAENIIGRTDWRRSGTQWTRRFTLIAFDSATYELPPLIVHQSKGNPLETNALTLNVFPTRSGREISDMAGLRDIRREPVAWTDYWPWAAGLLVAVLLLVWRWRKRPKKPAPQPLQQPVPGIQVSASELALQKLAQLQQKQLWKQGQSKEHYAELSMILREYLESKYRIAALESTTGEIQTLLKATEFPAGLRPELMEILQKTDLVKYAQSQLPEVMHDAVLIKAQGLIAPAQAKKTEPKKVNPAPPQPKPPSGKYEPL